MMSSETAGPGTLVTPQWLEANRSERNVRLIEIAGMNQDDMQAYKAGHVPGAICWKWKEALWDSHMREFPDADEFARRMGAAGIANDTTVVLYGEGIQFGIYAWWVLTYCGHKDARLLDGGRYRWEAEGRALEVEISPPPAAVSYEPVSPNPRMRIFKDDILEAIKRKDHVIIDARSPEEYSGERVAAYGGPDVGAVRTGRIPGAQHLFFEDLLDETKSFLPKGQLQAIADTCGLNSDDPVITYCRMSHRSTVVYFVLTQILGTPDVRVYDGSWTEWGNLVGVPIER